MGCLSAAALIPESIYEAIHESIHDLYNPTLNAKNAFRMVHPGLKLTR